MYRFIFFCCYNCGYDENKIPCGKEKPILLTKKENKKRNLALAADLKNLGYSITKIIGNYPEGNTNVKEILYFITSEDDMKTFIKNIASLGKKYNQDSVLIILVKT